MEGQDTVQDGNYVEGPRLELLINVGEVIIEMSPRVKNFDNKDMTRTRHSCYLVTPKGLKQVNGPIQDGKRWRKRTKDAKKRSHTTKTPKNALKRTGFVSFLNP